MSTRHAPTPQMRLIIYVMYVMLAGAIVWNVVSTFTHSGGDTWAKMYDVSVSGNVQKPGRYRVPKGTSQFEILKVAGVRPTSNLASIDLTAQVEQGADLSVGTLDKPVALTQQGAGIMLEFSFGELTIISSEGRTRPAQEGMHIDAGDRILTEARSQVELSVNVYSRIDMDDFSELSFDKIGSTEGDKNLVEVFHKSGICWYKMAYADSKDLYRIVTPLTNITVAGQGADFMVEVKYDEVDIHCLDGLLLAERPSGEETVNLIGGQTAAVFSDGRPIQVRSLAPDVSPNEKFSRLVKEKTESMMRRMPLTFMLFGIPASYFLVSLQFDRSVAHVVNIPAGLAVGDYVQGVGTLDKALLQGGPALATMVVEKVMDSRVSRYTMLNKDNVARIAASIGDIFVDVDPKAASVMGLRTGKQKLGSESIVQFVSPALSGWDDAQRRQMLLIKTLFESISNKTVVLTALLANQLIAGVETNMTSTEVMDELGKLASHKGWKFMTHRLPTQQVVREGRTSEEPMLEECRKLLSQEK